MGLLIITIYSLALFLICLFSLEQLYLSFLYKRSRRKENACKKLDHFPMVTIQLPVYNERYVVERLIDCICEMDYPTDKLEIQVLDDSKDETSDLINKKTKEWSKKGYEIRHIQRADREGFKAGALQYGLKRAKGEFIAIFDADFLPNRDFLKKTLPAFDVSTGMVQTRWGHINQDYNLLTRMQAFGLNAHFTVEQTGRHSSGKLINFNGTGGVWRKECIESAGGWHFDTLTEDLDLSYRAQLKGWKFKYLEEIESPAELPVLVPAIKSQQYRWNKGAAETARKNIGNILRSGLSPSVKFHGILHLLNSSVFLLLFIASIFSLPVLFITGSSLNPFANAASFFFIGFLAVMIFYYTSSRASQPNFSLKYYLTHLPLFLIFSMGLSLHNALAVAEGYLGIKTPFVRTPKFNIRSKADQWHGNVYLNENIAPITIIEGLMAVYFLCGIISGLVLGEYGLLMFHIMLTLGFGGVFFLSLNPIAHAKAR